jgi:hypothetical protein
MVAVVQIPNLPAAISLNGTEQLEAVQAGTSVRVTVDQIAAYAIAQYPPAGVTSIVTTSPITGGVITTTGTLGLETAGVTNLYLAGTPAGTIKANVTGGTASPSDVTVSAVLDLISTTRGTMLYRNATQWVALAPGTAGYLLSTNGGGADPSWVPSPTLMTPIIAQQFVETYVDAPIVAGVLTIDLTLGSVFRTTIDANITDINIIGAVGGYDNSFTWKAVGNGTGYTQAWSSVPIVWPSAADPVLTTTLNAVDWYSFMLDDGDWYGFVAGQNY